jgi:hypothetical protein
MQKPGTPYPPIWTAWADRGSIAVAPQIRMFCATPTGVDGAAECRASVLFLRTLTAASSGCLLQAN